VHNWTQSAERPNYENLVFLDDPDVASRFAREFQRLWRKAKE
jgi:phosphatidylserine/phosphatidylglycerophosphate/cardiolipin synthase-like enzyme